MNVHAINSFIKNSGFVSKKKRKIHNEIKLEKMISHNLHKKLSVDLKCNFIVGFHVTRLNYEFGLVQFLKFIFI